MEVIEVKRGHKNGALIHTISVLIRRDTRKLVPPFPHLLLWRYSRKVAVCKPGRELSPESAAPWSWTSQLPELWENKFSVVEVTQFTVLCYGNSGWQRAEPSMNQTSGLIGLFLKYVLITHWASPPASACVCVCAQSCPTFCDPMGCSLPGSSVHGILQARILEWLPSPPPGDLPNPKIKPTSLTCPALAGGFFTISTIWKAQYLQKYL